MRASIRARVSLSNARARHDVVIFARLPREPAGVCHAVALRSLDMKPMVDLTSRALARLIEGKTPEEIRSTFHLPDDLTGTPRALNCRG